MKLSILATSAAVFLTASPLWAETVVSPGGKPGAASSWTKKGDAVTLTLQEGYSADDVADAIRRAVPGAVAKVKGDKVVVTGVAEASLLVALERVQVDRGLDDIDNALSNLQTAGSEGEGSGSSIRAAAAAQVPGMTEGALEVTGIVVSVRHKTYPKVAIEIEVQNPPKGVPNKLTVVPAVKMAKGRPDLKDPDTKANATAWYSRAGDTIQVNVVLPTDGSKTFVAKTFKRVGRSK